MPGELEPRRTKPSIFFVQAHGLQRILVVMNGRSTHEKDVPCSVCGTSLVGKAFVICSTCEIPCHPECWETSGSCPAFGCGSTTPMDAAVALFRRPPSSQKSSSPSALVIAQESSGILPEIGSAQTHELQAEFMMLTLRYKDLLRKRATRFLSIATAFLGPAIVLPIVLGLQSADVAVCFLAGIVLATAARQFGSGLSAEDLLALEIINQRRTHVLNELRSRGVDEVLGVSTAAIDVVQKALSAEIQLVRDQSRRPD